MFFERKPHKIICVGSTSQDIFFPTDEGLIIETPGDITSKEKIAFELGGKIRVKNRFEAVGGVAANVAHGLNHLGQVAHCYSKIGKDEVGRWIEKEFDRGGAPKDLLFVDSSVQSDLSAIVVNIQSGERVIFHNRDANEHLEIIDREFKDVEWVFLSALNGSWRENLRKILALKERYNFSLAYNPGQHNIKEDGAVVAEVLRASDILLLNKDEAIELVLSFKKDVSDSDLNDEKFLLSALHKEGAELIALSDGKRGAWGFDGAEYWFCPIYTRSGVVDTTGAGDAFGSGFFSAHLEGLSIEQGLRYGMANSGSVVGEYGAIKGLLTREEINNCLHDIIPERLH